MSDGCVTRAPLNLEEIDAIEARWLCSVTGAPCAWKEREDRGRTRWWCARCQRGPFDSRAPGEVELALVATVRALREHVAELEASGEADAGALERMYHAGLERAAKYHDERVGKPWGSEWDGVDAREIRALKEESSHG